MSNPQVNVNPITVVTAVITALGAMTVTAANASNELLSVNSKSLINLSNAGEKLTAAVDERAGIYGDAIVKNGALAEREHTLKQQLRLAALEQQEATAKNNKRAAAKPAPKTRKAKSTPKKKTTTRKTRTVAGMEIS